MTSIRQRVYNEPLQVSQATRTERYTKKKPVVPELTDYTTVVESRAFTRWYRKNKKTIHALSLATPAVAFTLFGVTESILPYLIGAPTSIPVAMIPTSGINASFMNTHGVILIHMMLIGFLTLVVSTFLRFTGRGDLVPLIAFVGGGAILYEVLGMFKDIYVAVVQFMQL